MTVSIKGSVNPAGSMTNLFALTVLGMPPMRVAKVGSLERKINMAMLPDGTFQSTGRIDPMTTSISVLVHHPEDRIAVNTWFLETAANSPTAKKIATLSGLTPVGIPLWAVTLLGAQLSGHTLPDFDAGSDGQPVYIDCELSIDDWSFVL